MFVFMSTYKWNPKDEEWQENGGCINMATVDWFQLEQSSSLGGDRPATWSIKACYRGNGEYPGTRHAVISGAPEADMALRIFGVLLYNAGIPYYPPLPKTDIEHAIKPGLVERPSAN